MTVDDAINEILKREGGYTNNPNDSGGETNWGITVADARTTGYTGDMRDLPRNTAKLIYLKKYWTATGIDKISGQDTGIAFRLLDIAVNMGTQRAGEFCQRLLNALNRGGRDYFELEVDGVMGPGTRDCLAKFLLVRGGGENYLNAASVFEKGLRALQGTYYIELAERRPKDEEFLYGWLFNRV